MENHSYLSRSYEIDTEFILSFLRYLINNNDLSIEKACLEVNKEIYGTVSVAIYDALQDLFLIFSNFGSLGILTDNESLIIFAFERNILSRLTRKHKIF